MLGQYTGFILASYGTCALVLGLLTAWVILDGRKQARLLTDMEARGISRRSARRRAKPAAATSQPASTNA